MTDAKSETKAVVMADKTGALVPTDLDGVQRVAGMFIASGMMPKGMDSVASVGTAILHGLEVGLKPMQAVQSIAVINGRPTIWGDAMLGLVKASGHLEDFFEEPIVDDKGAVTGYRCVAKRVGMSRPTISIFTVEMAKRAKLWGKQGPWSQYPERMLQMRARGFALRDAFPDALKGMITAEEARDMHQERDVTPDAGIGAVLAKAKKTKAKPAIEEPAPVEVEEKILMIDKDTGEVLDEEPSVYQQIMTLGSELGAQAVEDACSVGKIALADLDEKIAPRKLLIILASMQGKKALKDEAKK